MKISGYYNNGFYSEGGEKSLLLEQYEREEKYLL